MSAMPYLLVRARRWFDERLLRSRAAQLAALIARIEQALRDDLEDLTRLRAEHDRIAACLRKFDAHDTCRPGAA
jgi:hypothetical protein